MSEWQRESGAEWKNEWIVNDNGIQRKSSENEMRTKVEKNENGDIIVDKVITIAFHSMLIDLDANERVKEPELTNIRRKPGDRKKNAFSFVICNIGQAKYFPLLQIPLVSLQCDTVFKCVQYSEPILSHFCVLLFNQKSGDSLSLGHCVKSIIGFRKRKLISTESLT